MATIQFFRPYDGIDTAPVAWTQKSVEILSGLPSRAVFESGALRLELRGGLEQTQDGKISGDIWEITLTDGAAQVYRIAAPTEDNGLHKLADAGTLVDAILHGNYDAHLETLIFGGDDRAEGSIGDDRLATGAGNDDILLAGGNDLVLAGAGDDRVLDGAGSDRVDGGAGFDTVSWHGSLADYKVARSGAAFTVTDLKTGDVDTLSSVERLEFFDKFVAADVGPDTAGGQVFRLYQAAFGRLPDQHGLLYWTGRLEHGDTVAGIAGEFVKSQEYREQYHDNPSTHDLLVKYYDHVLHRAPDAEGLAYWTAVLDSHRASVAEVLADFSESPENVAGTAALIANGVVLDYSPIF